MPADDPWLWTVDDLIAQVCHSRRLFDDAGSGPASSPDLQILESQLRHHQIDGAVLLNGFNDITLRDDLGIQSLGQRQALLAIVRLLRSRSFQYRRMSGNRDGFSPLRSNGPAAETTVLDSSGRKRRKVNVTTITQPTNIREHQTVIQAIPTAQNLADASINDLANGSGEWDYLLKYANDDEDEILDFNVEEDQEEEGDSPDATDIDEPVLHHEELRGGKVSPSEVVEVINDCIAQFTDAWYPGKVTPKDQPVNRREMWDKAEDEGQRMRLVERSKREIEHYEARLNEIGDEIMRNPWNHLNEVRRICGNLEATVENLEYERWLVQIYESSDGQEPENRVITDIIDLGSGSDSSDTEVEMDEVELVSATDGLSVEVHIPSARGIVGKPKPIPTDKLRSDGVQSLSQRPSQLQRPQTPQAMEQGPPSFRRPYQPQSQGPSPQRAFPSQNAQLFRPKNFSRFQKPQHCQSFESQKLCGPDQSIPRKALLQNKDRPGLASISTVAKWEWKDLVDQADRKRVILKIVHEMNNTDRETLRTRMITVRKQNLLMEIPQCIAMLLRGDNKIPGILPRDLPKIVNFTKLFLSWWLCDNYFHKVAKQSRLEELSQCLEDKSTDPDVFYSWVNHILENTFSKEALARSAAPSQGEIIVISDPEDDAPKPIPAPRKTPIKGSRSLKTRQPPNGSQPEKGSPSADVVVLD